MPASRFRVGQFLDHWRAAGIECDVRYGYGDRYNSLVGTRIAAPYKLLSRLKRIPYAADADEFDLVFVQRPALPQSAAPERLLNWLNPNTIFDFDDSLVHGPTQQVEPNRVRTFQAIIDSCRHVIAGNRYLARTADAPQKTTIIPTVIDTDAYVPARRRSDTKVVGWMGTAGNFCMLDFLIEPLRALHERRPDITIRLVSNAPYKPLEGLEHVEQIRWSKDRELELLQSFDVGLMPLEDADVSRGKCAFKMIMYMAVGTPVVVSAVEANVDVMGDVDAGRVMPTFADWDIAIEELIDNPDLRARQGAAGRARVETEYSVASVVPKYLTLFERLAK